MLIQLLLDGWMDGWTGQSPVFPCVKVLEWIYATALGGHLLRTKDPLAIFVAMCLPSESTAMRRNSRLGLG